MLGGGALNRVVDASRGPMALPPAGLVLSRSLADLLGVRRGDRVRMEVLEGNRPVRDVTVVDLVDEYLGTNAYMDLDALHRLMQEGRTLSGAYLQVDAGEAGELYRRLKATPRVAGVLRKRAAIESLQGTLATMMRQIQVIYVLFASVIAFGVVYNSVRISLSERGRELATLRVIGFTRAEVSYILLGEVALVTPGGRADRPGARVRPRGRDRAARRIPRCSAFRWWSDRARTRWPQRRSWWRPSSRRSSSGGGSTGSTWSRCSRRGNRE